ncbi:hypothetical protein CBR_g57091 [Chara braunii]|uniref:Uncharacterized protein n=1 Tax=Chara braunii TaxID=69332 RepID=A0A388K822_CHABU|nr:hypothetical protein CBR_g57091 [Chara braunii]|eukprot:GBG66212.1 hypothetical protein CBR_g57091 [Chara braunii]
MEQQPGETTEVYEARMLDMVAKYKQRAAAATSARKKDDEEAEEQRRLAEQQRQADTEAARKAADECRRLRRDKLLECEGDIEVIAGKWAVAAEEEGAASHVRDLATTSKHVSDLVRRHWSRQCMVLTRSNTSGMEQQPGETTEAYEARMLDMVAKYKQRAVAVTSARKKEDEEAEEQGRLAEQQRQADTEAARKVADERRRLRRDKLLECEGDIEVFADKWAVAAEEEGAPSAVRGLATTSEHVSDLVATCAVQQEDILCVDTLVRKQIRVIDELLDRVRQVEQQLASVTPAGPFNLTNRVNVLEIDVKTLKDGALTTYQRIDLTSRFAPPQPVQSRLIARASRSLTASRSSTMLRRRTRFHGGASLS